MLLSERLKQILQDFVQEDQCGFLPRYQLKHIVGIMVDIIEYLQYYTDILDVEEAYDNLNWDFIFKVVDKMTLGRFFWGEDKGNLCTTESSVSC